MAGRALQGAVQPAHLPHLSEGSIRDKYQKQYMSIYIYIYIYMYIYMYTYLGDIPLIFV
jgi:hypothetical protein